MQALQTLAAIGFGVWKQRFQSLLYGVTVHMHIVKLTNVALAVLHNIAIDHQDTFPENDDDIHIIQENSFAAPTNESGRGRVGNSTFLGAFIDEHFNKG